MQCEHGAGRVCMLEFPAGASKTPESTVMKSIQVGPGLELLTPELFSVGRNCYTTKGNNWSRRCNNFKYKSTDCVEQILQS